ncbi:MAG: hypothetical protein ACFFC7_34930 [Candidatus Hermodarchaeota archaeon]
MRTRKDAQFTNVIIVVSCLLLTTSYFLPVEDNWSPVDAWSGYYVGDEFVKEFNMALVETFPFGVGIIILISLILSEKPTASVATIAIFAIMWIISLVWEVLRIVQNPHYRFRILWLILAVLIIPTVVVIFLLFLRKYQKTTTIFTLGAVLAASSILQQSCLIAWYLLEDKLFLNVGCVTGMVASAALLIGLLFKRQILCHLSDAPNR